MPKPKSKTETPPKQPPLPLNTKDEWVTALLCALADFDGFSDFGTEKKKANRKLHSSFEKLRTAAEKFTEECLSVETLLRQWSYCDFLNEWTEYFRRVDCGENQEERVDALIFSLPDKDLARDYLTAAAITEIEELKLREMAEQKEYPPNAFLAEIVRKMECEEGTVEADSVERTLDRERAGPNERAKRRLELLSKRIGTPASQKFMMNHKKPILQWALLDLYSPPRVCGFVNVWRWVKDVVPVDRIAGKPMPRNRVWCVLRNICERDEKREGSIAAGNQQNCGSKERHFDCEGK